MLVLYECLNDFLMIVFLDFFNHFFSPSPWMLLNKKMHLMLQQWNLILNKRPLLFLVQVYDRRFNKMFQQEQNY